MLSRVMQPLSQQMEDYTPEEDGQLGLEDLRIEDRDDADEAAQEQDFDTDDSLRPVTVRSISEPTPAMLLNGYFASECSKTKPVLRNRSPFSRSHLRSRSSGSALTAPAMIRAHSMPAVHSISRDYSSTSSGSLSPNLSSNHSPQRSPARVRSPLAYESQESSYFHPPRSPKWFESTVTSGPIESIQEDSELDLTPKNTAVYQSAPPVTLASRSGSMRRRPVSPSHSLIASPALPVDAGSPALAPTKFSEAFPSSFQLHHYASTSSFSSISSTPSSARSRSPSISSLETIEDAPDAEYEAIEADRQWRLQLSDKSGEDSGDDNTYRRKGFGFGRGRNTERKRWSVCGGERRADLDLETIWED